MLDPVSWKQFRKYTECTQRNEITAYREVKIHRCYKATLHIFLSDSKMEEREKLGWDQYLKTMRSDFSKTRTESQGLCNRGVSGCSEGGLVCSLAQRKKEITKKEKTKLFERKAIPFCILDGRNLRLEVPKNDPGLGILWDPWVFPFLLLVQFRFLTQTFPQSLLQIFSGNQKRPPQESSFHRPKLPTPL